MILSPIKNKRYEQDYPHGKTKEGIEAYKKSLELNPDNDNAKKVLEELGN